MSTGIVYHPDYLKHNTGSHPETSGRLVAIMDTLKEAGLADKIESIQPRNATIEQIEYIHIPEYIEHVKRTCERQGSLDMDTPVSKDSYDAALLAAGGAICAGDAVMNEEVNSVFALVRPPGHHAESDSGMGFCLFNNIAILARHLQKEHALNRIMIIDWDTHHGNGTQHSFYDDPTVLYSSLHQSPLYPGTGMVHEVGSGEGEGFTVNVPFPPSTGDSGYMLAYNEILAPIADQFQPEFILISAGQDAHYADLLAGMSLTTNGYGKMAQIIKSMAEKHCSGRIVLTLEGGYNLDAQASSILAVLNVLGEFDLEVDEMYEPPADELSDSVKQRVEHVKQTQSKYWSF